MAQTEISRNLRHNYTVNILDGGFFGFALGFASFATILPLFIARMTDSALLIGLIPAIHNLGWQFPQLLTAQQISRLPRLKGYVLFMTTQERLPFLGLAVISWLLPVIGPRWSLILAFAMLVWQGIGAGLTANAWQNLIGKVIPGEVRGTFFGLQSSASNLLASIGALAAGLLLERLAYPQDFGVSFLLCSLLMGISWFFLSLTREPHRSVPILTEHQHPLWRQVREILQKDRPFRWFLLSRFLFQFGMMSFAFYTVYAVEQMGMSEFNAGVLTSLLLISGMVANPIFGWLADRWSRKWVMAIGAFAGFASSILAWMAPNLNWFYPIIILEGMANTVFWIVGITFTLEFGTEEERPTYVGMSNTLIAPSAIVAPLIGGWLADRAGYPAAFLVAAIASLITTLIFVVFVSDPTRVQPTAAAPVESEQTLPGKVG